MAVREMKARPELDTWYSRVNSIKTLLNIRNTYGKKEAVSKCFVKCIKSCFDRFWLDQVNDVRLDKDGNDRNKLRFYKTIKGSFSPEPYVSYVTNRSQRAWLSRFRVSAVANLRLKADRYVTPLFFLKLGAPSHKKTG